MTKNDLVHHLTRLGACSDSLTWLREQRCATASEAWAACDRIDWMMWLAGRCDLRRQSVDCACDFAACRLPGAEAC